MLARRPRHLTGTASRPAIAVAAPVLGVAVMVGLWTVGGRAGWADGFVVTPAEAIRPLFGDNHDLYRRAISATVWAAARGLLIGGGLAFVAALVAASVPALRKSITRLAAIANAAPWVAIAPCLLIVLGRQRGPVAVAAIAVFFFVFVSTTVGLGSAPPAAHDVATALGASRARRVWSVQLPAAWSSVTDGVKLAAPAALAGAVFGEWYGAERGLGVLLISAMQGARAERLWAAALLCAACGLAAYGTLAAVRAMVVRRFGGTVGADAVRPGARRRPHDWLREGGAIAIMVAVLVGVWWAWIELGDVSAIVAPRPSAVLADVAESPGEYVAATAQTLRTAAIALALGTAVGLVAALAASRFELLAGMTVPFVILLAATPLVALFPLFARVLGYNATTVWALAALLVFYPVFVYARSGLAAASATSLDVARALGANRKTRFRGVVLPSAVPHIVSGFRIACGSAVIAAVVGESLVGRSGLGVEFAYSYNVLELPRAFGAAIFVVLASVAVFALAGAFERRVHERWT